MGRLHADQLVQVLPRGVDLARRLRSVELRGVAADRPHLRLERLGDINHEGRLHRVFAVGEGVQDFERPVGLARRPVLREAGEVAGVAAQLRGDAVVGMPAHGEGEDDDPRARRADERSEEHTSELQSLAYLVCRLLLEKKNDNWRREIGFSKPYHSSRMMVFELYGE